MMSDEKTRLLIGTLAAAVIIVVGFGVFRELGRSSEPAIQPITPVNTSAPSQEAASTLPPMRIEAEASVVANTSEHQASIPGNSDLSYEWSISGGTIQGVTTSTSVTWTAGAGPTAVLTCKVTNPVGKTETVTFQAALRQPPAITQFEAIPPVITEGTGAKLTWKAASAEKLTLDPGGQDVSRYAGSPLEVKPKETTTYTLTATNPTGVTVTRELQIKVVPVPTITALRAEPVPGSTTTFTAIGEFTGGKAELKKGDQVVTTSDTSPLRIQLTDVKEGTSYSFKVTNEAGSFVTSNLTFSLKNK